MSHPVKKRKKIVNIVRKKPFFQRLISNYDHEMMTYICPPHWSTTIEKKRIPIQKQNKNHTLDQRMQKTAQYKNIAVKTQRYRIISDYGKHFQKKNKNAKKNGKPQKP